MTQLVRFLFDECLAAGPLVQTELAASLKLSGVSAEIVHFYQKFAPGVEDTVWISQIAREDGWIVISGDRGTHSRQGEKLPQICAVFGVTHVILSDSLLKRNWHYKSLAFAARWVELAETAQAPKGSGFKLSIAGEGSFRLQPMTPLLSESPPHQKDLFADQGES